MSPRGTWLIGLLALAACNDSAVEPAPVEPPEETEPEAPEPQDLAGSWLELSPLAAPRSSFAAVLVERDIYLAGGFSGGDAAQSSLAAYNLDAQTETHISQLPLPAAGAAAFATDDSIIVAGGMGGFITMPVVPHEGCHRFDLFSAFWTTCPNVGNGPTTHAATTTRGEVGYLFGGVRRIESSGSYPTKVVQRFHTGEHQWNAETVMPELRDGAAAFIYDGSAYVVGGRALNEQTGIVTFPQAILRYDTATYTWTSDGLAPLPTARWDLRCVVHHRSAYCMGGRDASGAPVAVVERFDFESAQWVSLAPMPLALRSMTLVADTTGITVLGGRDHNGADYATVYRLE